MLDMGFKPQLDRDPGAAPAQAADAALLGHHGRRGGGLRAHPPARPGHASRWRAAAPPPSAPTSRSSSPASRRSSPLLLALLGDDELSTLVFTRTKRRADKVAKALDRAGHKVARIHADRSQAQRRKALEGFKDGQYRVLVATDIAARGIDVAEIGHVVNFDLPARARGLRPPRRPHRARRGQRPRLEPSRPRTRRTCSAGSRSSPASRWRAPRCRATRPSSRRSCRAPPPRAPTPDRTQRLPG